MPVTTSFETYLQNALTDDTGDKKSGTLFDEAFFVALGQQLDAWLKSTAYPTHYPNATTDEVYDAFVGWASLKARLDAIADPSTGVPVAATFISYLLKTEAAKQLGSGNLCCNDDLLLWPNGDSAVPSYLTLFGGTPATVARCGSGLADTTAKVGPYCAKLTFGSNPSGAYWTPISTTAATKLSHLKGVQKFAYGMWVWCATANAVRLFADDGASVTYSSYHTGDSTWQFLTIPPTVWNGGATQLLYGLRMEAASSAYISGATCIASDIAIAWHIPCATETVNIGHAFISGNVATGDDKTVIPTPYPYLLVDLLATVITAPTVSALVFDVDWLDFSGGAAPSRQVPYSTKLQIAAAAGSGRAAPDGTYQYRCFQPNFSGGKKGGALAINVDTDDGGNTAASASVMAVGMRYKRPEWISRYDAATGGY